MNIPIYVLLSVMLAAAPEPMSVETFAKEVAERAEHVKPGKDVGWTKIPWAKSLVEARRLSQQEDALVFLFSHQGNIGTGRC